MINVLFIEDDEQTQRVLKNVLSEDFFIIPSTNGRQGIEKVKTEKPDVVLLDIGLPDLDGLDVLQKIVEMRNSPPVVMLTCFSETPLVVKAMKTGAWDYLTKPYKLDHLKKVLLNAIKSKNEPLMTAEEEVCYFSTLLGESPAMKEVKRRVLLYAKTDSTILINGESGTGKDVTANLIHSLSPRKEGPFIPLNCGAIPSQLIESELFGSVKGAFTDAVTRAGSFEQADGGTLFLNEIGEMPYSSQVKLLQALEHKQISRVGSSQYKPVNVRIVAATNRNLKKAIRKRLFREDLFYRLNILNIDMPALRERKEDISLLATHFLRTLSHDHHILLPGTIEKLEHYSWPGNIRELKNIIERAALHASGHTVRPQDITFE